MHVTAGTCVGQCIQHKAGSVEVFAVCLYKDNKRGLEQKMGAILLTANPAFVFLRASTGLHGVGCPGSRLWHQ